MTLLKADMIKNFPGSDDTRGTTTRVYYSIPYPEDDTHSPEMRPDEFPGPLGEILNTYNLTRQTLSACQIVEVDGLKSINAIFDTNRLEDINEAISYLNDTINAKIVDLSTAYGQVYNFVITKLDVVKNYTNTSGLHNQSGTHTVFVTWNYDVIVYGQFTPNPLIQPNPEPQVCEIYQGSSTLDTGFFAPLGDCQANDTDPTLIDGQFKINVGARIVANTNAIFYLNTPIVANQIYTLYYSIPAYSFSGPGGTGEIKFSMSVNGQVIHIFTLFKSIQNGYIQFSLPSNAVNAEIEFICTQQLGNPLTAVKDFGSYMFFGLANQYCALS